MRFSVSDTQSDERILSFLPYVKGTTIGRTLNKHNIRIIFEQSKKIGQILRNSKKYTLEKSKEWSTYE